MIELNLKPDPKQLRVFGLIGMVFFAGFGVYAYLRQSLFGFELGPEMGLNTAYMLGGIAGLCAVLAAVLPRALLPLFVVLTIVTFPIGFVVSHVIMLLLFFAVITPIGLVMRAGGWDPLTRTIDKSAPTYWVPRAKSPPPGRYFRQY